MNIFQVIKSIQHFYLHFRGRLFFIIWGQFSFQSIKIRLFWNRVNSPLWFRCEFTLIGFINQNQDGNMFFHQTKGEFKPKLIAQPCRETTSSSNQVKELVTKSDLKSAQSSTVCFQSV